MTAGGALINREQLLAHIEERAACFQRRTRRTSCFHQAFLGQIFIHQHKTEAREQSVPPALLQLLPFIFHVCFSLSEEPVSYL